MIKKKKKGIKISVLKPLYIILIITMINKTHVIIWHIQLHFLEETEGFGGSLIVVLTRD